MQKEKMTNSIFLIALVLASSCVLGQTISIGDALTSSYKGFNSLPITNTSAASSGWARYGPCIPGLGYPWSAQPGGPDRSSPQTLYYSAAGQVSGMAVDIFGSVPQALLVH